MLFGSGAKCEGSWVEDMREGHCTFTDVTGTYVGEWVADKVCNFLRQNLLLIASWTWSLYRCEQVNLPRKMDRRFESWRRRHDVRSPRKSWKRETFTRQICG
jgi:hypothetical protein